MEKNYGITTWGRWASRMLTFSPCAPTGPRRWESKAWPIWPAHPELRIGGDFEIFSRPEWRAVAAAYGLGAMKRRQYQPDFLYRAVTSGDADVVSAFSSDGRIARYGLVILDDPKAALPPYDAMLLVGPAHAHDAKFLARAEAPDRPRYPLPLMQQANLMVDRDQDKQTPAATAAWLDRHLSH